MKQANEYRLKLYVTGGTRTAEQAILALKKLTRRLAGKVQSEVVDVLLHPELILDPCLRPTPVLIRVQPLPIVAFRGAIPDLDQLIRILRLDD